MSEANHCDRRRFLGTAVTAIAGAGLLASRSGAREAWSRGATARSANDALDPIAQSDARAFNARYAEGGPSNGPPVILLHEGSGGVDTDIARMAAKGYRVIVPYVTSSDTPSAGSGVMQLMGALKIEKALVSGLGESARTSEVIAALWPQRLKAVIPVSGTGVVTLAAAQRPLPPKEELAWWYQYYLPREGEA
jgi:pimeloyl-ACP methyl ester carboxylesterase